MEMIRPCSRHESTGQANNTLAMKMKCGIGNLTGKGGLEMMTLRCEKVNNQGGAKSAHYDKEHYLEFLLKGELDL